MSSLSIFLKAVDVLGGLEQEGGSFAGLALTRLRLQTLVSNELVDTKGNTFLNVFYTKQSNKTSENCHRWDFVQFWGKMSFLIDPSHFYNDVDNIIWS